MSKRLFLAAVISLCPTFLARTVDAKRPKSESTPMPFALEKGNFSVSERLASDAIAKRADDSKARAVRALSRWVQTAEQVRDDVWTGFMMLSRGGLNDQYFRWALNRTDERLGVVDEDLAIAARDAAFSLDLCLACIEHAWLGDDRVGSRDRALLEVELDGAGKPLPEGDPRRRPTFRFDVGDLHWARAMVGFQRALVNLILGFDWKAVQSFAHSSRFPEDKLVIPVAEAARLVRAQTLALSALDASDAARLAYLAESDDQREWVPNPKQKNHPLPLPVDAKLYETWRAIIDDVRKLFKGEEAVAVDDLLHVIKRESPLRPGGYLDLRTLLFAPSDRVVDIARAKRAEKSGETAESVREVARAFFGPAYVHDGKATALLGRLKRMSEEIRSQEESFERKLRYLLWLN